MGGIETAVALSLALFAVERIVAGMYIEDAVVDRETVALWATISTACGALLFAANLDGDISSVLGTPGRVAQLVQHVSPEVAIAIGMTLAILPYLAWFSLYAVWSPTSRSVGVVCALTIIAVMGGGIAVADGVHELRTAADAAAARAGSEGQPAASTTNSEEGTSAAGSSSQSGQPATGTEEVTPSSQAATPITASDETANPVEVASEPAQPAATGEEETPASQSSSGEEE